jgi:GT2 family glycosyltransferase
MPQNSELIILLDDCTDNTLSCVNNFKDKRIRTIISKERLGINKSRNFLINESRGEFVAIMDADDVCFPWRFWLSLHQLKSVDAVFGTAIIFGSKLRPIPILPQIPISLSGYPLKLALALANPIVHSTATIRKSTLEALTGYSSAKSEDYDLWLRMQAAGFKMLRSRVPLVAYRFHPSQASQSVNFNSEVAKDQQLRYSLEALRSQIAIELTGHADWTSEVESKVRALAYQSSPFLRLEHAGLPNFLRRWKEKSIQRHRQIRELP